MKCSHCGNEWMVGAQSIQKIRNCPFCGKSLHLGIVSSQKPENLEQTLCRIRDQFGMEPFRNGKALLGLHADLMPDRQRDRRLIGHFVACEGNAFLENALNKPKAEQPVALVQLVKRMHEDWLIREDAARQICAVWWKVLGGDPECLKQIAQPIAPAAGENWGAGAGSQEQKPAALYRPEHFRIEGEVLKEYTGKDPVIRIPDGVVTIGRGAFARCRELRSVTIPAGVRTVDMQAFLGCENLEQVSLPAGVKTIGYAAFRDCTALKELTLPEGVRHIDDYAFKNCAALKTVHFPENMDTIGYEAFQDCAALQEANLPRGLKHIVGCAFWGCSELRKVTLPEGLQSVGDYAFARCKALTQVRIPGSLSKISGNMFLNCERLERVELCEGVQSIGVDAFDKCVALKTVLVPDSLKEIHEKAFQGCGGISVQASASWKRSHPDLLARIPG